MTTFKIPEHLRYDKRMIERNLQNGELTPGQLDKHLGALSDVEHNAEAVVLEEDMPVEEAVVVEPAFGGDSYSSASSYTDPAASSFSDTSAFAQSAPAAPAPAPIAEQSPPAYVAPTPPAAPAAVPFAAAPTPAAPAPTPAAQTPAADTPTPNPFGGSTPSSEPGDPGVG